MKALMDVDEGAAREKGSQRGTFIDLFAETEFKERRRWSSNRSTNRDVGPSAEIKTSNATEPANYLDILAPIR